MSPSRHTFAYAALLAAAFAVALAASWTPLGTRIDNYVYDSIFLLYQPAPWQPESAILAIDEPSLHDFGGLPGLRMALAEGLTRIAAASPRAVAVDVIPADNTADEKSAKTLEDAFHATHNLILPCDLTAKSGWDDPLPRFRRWAAAVGHVHLDLDPDGVGRTLALEKAAGHDRRWALSLEAYRVSRGATIVETPRDLELGSMRIPAANATDRSMRIRFAPPDTVNIPSISLKQLRDDPARARQFAGKIVFAGVTAQTAAKDRWPTPYSPTPMAGVEVLANAYETIAQQRFLTSAPAWSVVTLCMLLAAVVGVAFAWLSGWWSNLAALGVLAVAHAVPYAAFTRGAVFPFSPGASTAWLTIVTAAAWQHLYVRRRLVKSEAERDRYQHAVQFVTHEMRTPLTAIQGSSELMSRYALPDEKRQQIVELIHSESKRLGRMIEMFLNVERLSAGEMELKRDHFSVRAVMAGCVERASPLAERKQIRIDMNQLGDEQLTGDRELMEYAFYNLLTNAIKYSPSKTEVTVYGGRDGERFEVSVKDQGIGMDQKEVRNIFQKFYRTHKAVQSGEAGTGIGLSIVEQIILQHGGKIAVTSAPGKGSCFTLILPAVQTAAPKPLAAN
ncbi:MAG: CHASE2 domain-containing protein [Acidobacteriia bacterium]|nr:CHASE2 domain-containing protein [Terriglobia bacterium]